MIEPAIAATTAGAGALDADRSENDKEYHSSDMDYQTNASEIENFAATQPPKALSPSTLPSEIDSKTKFDDSASHLDNSTSKSPINNDATEIATNNVQVIAAAEWKEKGNTYFAKEDWKQAKEAYYSGLRALKLETQCDKLLEVALRANIALSHLKLLEYDRAEKECDQLILISPSNSKALYRRACAREGLYFSQNNQKSIEPDDSISSSNNIDPSINGQTRDCTELLQGAINDLKQALFYLEKEQQKEERGQQQVKSGSSPSSIRTTDKNQRNKKNSIRMKMQCQRSLDRLQKEHDRREKLQPNSENEKLESTRNDDFILSKKQLQSQQKRDVLRLLIARYQNGKVLHGEAFFLLEWNWWVRWCRYVNFFDVNAYDTKKGCDTRISDDQLAKRTQHVLAYLPRVATLPLCFRKIPGDNEDDDSEDDDDDLDTTTSISPGPIDNSELLVRSDEAFFQQWYRNNFGINKNDIEKTDFNAPILKPNLIRGYHYEIIPREVYSALRYWYGETTPSLCRRITTAGSVNIYTRKSSKLLLSSQKAQRCNACLAPHARSRCKQCMMVQYCDRSCQESHWRFHRPHCKIKQCVNPSDNNKLSTFEQVPFQLQGGRVGLNNLGNTCFMNSALQSLSHATPLTRHFLSNRFRSDLNASNPLGTGGKLAMAYDNFLKDVWMKQGISSTSPTALKRAIALFAPRFAGTQQHDAQEFLAFLLDGLHEDLNRIRRAPYVEMPDVTDGQNMMIAAAEAWNAHKRRNDSLVMDTFYGQFQSTCICPKCDRVSVSFDTFNHVSLEIPSNDMAWATTNIPVMVHFAEGDRKPIRYGVTLRQQGFISDLKNAVASMSNVIVDRLVLADVYENNICKLLDDKQSISSINTTEDFIVAYEVTPYTQKDTLHMIVSHSLVIGSSNTNQGKEDEASSNGDENMIGNSIDNTGDSKQESIGLPFMTSITAKNSTCQDLWDLICGLVGRIVKSNLDVGTGSSKRGEMNSELEDVLTIHFVDAQGRPRYLFEKADGTTATNILPYESEERLSKLLGDECAENFLFLNLVWDLTTSKEKRNIIISPNDFLDFDIHSTLEAMLEEQSTNVSTIEQGVTLNQCFQSFSRPERLDMDNMWYCSRCKEHVQALKTMKLWRLPNILVIHLKRFEFKHALRRDKLSTFVDFPLAGLDMTPHCAHVKSTKDHSNFVQDNVPADYDLFAVINHYGRLGFGHYTAFAMEWDETGISEAWNAFDDSRVHQIKPSEIQSSAAYILFYRRRVFH